MALVPPPPLSKEEFEKAGFRDIEFDRWYRYESNPFGILLWLKDKIQNKECKNVFNNRDNKNENNL